MRKIRGLVATLSRRSLHIKEVKVHVIKIFLVTCITYLMFASQAWAYVGLCCAHCGGNMPLNIPGGGIPETHEFRFKVSQMYMYMDSLRDGTDEKSYGDYGPGTASGQYRGVPKTMDSWMTMVGGAYSFTDDFAAMIMAGYVRNSMDMTTTATPSDYTMFSKELPIPR